MLIAPRGGGQKTEFRLITFEIQEQKFEIV